MLPTWKSADHQAPCGFVPLALVSVPSRASLSWGGAMPTTRLNDAIQACLNRCRAHASPLTALATFLDELRQEGWSDLDIRGVETAAIRLLSAVVDPHPIEPAACAKCNWPGPVVIMRDADKAIYRCSNCQHQWREELT